MSNVSFGDFTKKDIEPGDVEWGDIGGDIENQTDLYGSFVSLGGKLILSARSISTNANILSTDYYIGCDSTSGPIQINLPDISSVQIGQEFVIKDEAGNSGTNPITINGNGALIDGESSFQLSASREAIKCVARSGFWAII